jgi:hypothetical protein
MKQRRRLEITTFRRRTTVILREGVRGEVTPLPKSNVQCPRSNVVMGSEVSTGSGSDQSLSQIQHNNQKKENDDELNN